MGLDIYYIKTKKRNVKNLDSHEYGKLEEELSKLESNNETTFDVGYQRKANFVYAFFSESIDYDTQIAVVDKCEIEELLEKCLNTLEKRDESFAEENLPTQSGFFFGGTDYDELYYEKVKDCADICEKILANVDFDNELLFIYFSW